MLSCTQAFARHDDGHGDSDVLSLEMERVVVGLAYARAPRAAAQSPLLGNESRLSLASLQLLKLQQNYLSAAGHSIGAISEQALSDPEMGRWSKLLGFAILKVPGTAVHSCCQLFAHERLACYQLFASDMQELSLIVPHPYAYV
jgi:hypothetical protein